MSARDDDERAQQVGDRLMATVAMSQVSARLAYASFLADCPPPPRLGTPEHKAMLEAIDEFLRDIYGHAFKEGAESTIHQWECAPNEPPAIPHGDCENEGSYQFVEDVKPKLRALLEGRSQ